MNRRTFTPEEANRTLPLVRRVTQDIVRTYRLLSLRAELYQVLKSEIPARPEGDEELDRLKRSMAAFSDEIDTFVAELDEIGCEVKDLKNGIVDFPARMDDRRVLLCWKLEEERVENWHEVTEGFGGRKPLPVAVPDD